MIIFGPIPSRRLGRSLGINNIPPKVCSYSCIYCQIGATNSMSIRRKEFFSPKDIFNEVEKKIQQLKKDNQKIDYLTFVPDGEPTLDINLGITIDKLKSFGIKIAVVTNASLIWKKKVQNDLMKADWVSVKIDSANEKIWREIDRPYGSLGFNQIVTGIKEFATAYKGTLVTETMLVKGVNDNLESLSKTAQLIRDLNPSKSYIMAPTRPPAEKLVKAPSEHTLNMAYQIYSSLLNDVELIVDNEGTDFNYSSNVKIELLSILSVHPMRKDAVEEFLSKAKSGWKLIDDLINMKVVQEMEFSGSNYYVKTI